MSQPKRRSGEITITLAEPALGRLEILAAINKRTPVREAEAILEAHLEREHHNQRVELMTDAELDAELADFDALGGEDPDG